MAAPAVVCRYGYHSCESPGRSKAKTQKALTQPKFACDRRLWIFFTVGSVAVIIGVIFCIFAFHSPHRDMKDNKATVCLMTDESIKYRQIQQIRYRAYSTLGPFMVGLGLFTQAMSLKQFCCSERSVALIDDGTVV